MSKSPAYVILNVGDQHCGSTVALCPPTIELDDGGVYHASRPQQWLWQCWLQLMQRTREVVKEHHAKLIVIHGGDLVEGDHHGTTQIISANPTAQASVVDACMKPVLDLHPDKMYFVRGTEAHVGKSAAFEERAAKGLKKDHWPVVPDHEAGTSSWWHLRLDVQDVLIDVAHQGRTGHREHTRASAAALYAHDIYMSHSLRGDPIPNLVLRAHYHRFLDSFGANPHTRVITNGCWQFKTAFTHAKVADTMASIGGTIIVIKDGKYQEPIKVDFPYARGPVSHLR